MVPVHSTNGNPCDAADTYNVLHCPNPFPEFQWETIIDRSDMEKHLLEYNRQSFRAAAKSPCGHGIIMDAITFNATSPAAREFLEGVIPHEWLQNTDLLREFLTSFFTPPNVLSSPPISTAISEDDLVKGFGRWKEHTSTSPSGRHLGHYKAILQDPTLLKCLTIFLDIAISRGISLSRWQSAINIMLEKDAGLPKINRLRIIHLFEADFNFILKLLWGHRLIQRATRYDLLNDGQHGSVPGRNAIELVMLNQISNDICRTQKTNIIRFENDASACYDRILVHLGMLAAQRCGMPTNAVKVHADTLRDMKYRVKTVHGISD
jgi:hypothetical protein